MRDFFRTLTGRAVLVTAATAVVSVIITALFAVPVAIRSVNTQVRAELDQVPHVLQPTARPAATRETGTGVRPAVWVAIGPIGAGRLLPTYRG